MNRISAKRLSVPLRALFFLVFFLVLAGNCRGATCRAPAENPRPTGAAALGVILILTAFKAGRGRKEDAERLKERIRELARRYTELERRYFSVMEACPEAVFEVDAGGKILYMNEKAREKFDPGGELIGSAFGALVAATSREAFRVFMNEAEKNGRASLEVVLRTIDGSHEVFDLSAAISGAEGRTVIIHARDPGELKRLRDRLKSVESKAEEAERELKEKIKELEEFALLAVRRELKMREIREMLQRSRRVDKKAEGDESGGRKD